MSYSVQEIAQAAGLTAVGDLTARITRPAEPANAGPQDLALAMLPAYEPALRASAARVAVLWPGADWQGLGLAAALFAPRPRLALASMGRIFAAAPDLAPGIHPSAVIDRDAEIGEDAWIGPLAVVGPGAMIGAGARIMAHVTIGREASLGADALLHPGVRIGARCRIGAGFIAHPNAVIGADGFSFVTETPGAAESAKASGKVATAVPQPQLRIASLGAVEIGDEVELGACTTVDRGTISDTRIGSGTKIDNQVQVGHNVRVGEACMICGQAGIAGSVEIGDRVILGGRVAISDHLRIGSDSVIAGGSLIAHNVTPQSVMMGGIPAVRRDLFTRQLLALRRLSREVGRLRQGLSPDGK